ncbi:ClpX C4-type zinc finger protein [Uliginosibacterium sp. 31-16]|uniref:ClpX C4-type zinc finger protein n=1 Tax=Uliginosibacterium sp. 31-16 TaxID=3068315 RepID=UPI00273D492C|nr:ClpX C4-type zinc finger protein [Uliginosibacterium sp. 31-16]MDP5239396.1 ClpX C4-type zinc finger protein [Uliginosibacterium sp. 31-16]
MNTGNSLELSKTMLELSDAISQLRERDEDEACCSFCGKRQSEVSMLVPGPSAVYICDLCVTRAATLIGQRA